MPRAAAREAEDGHESLLPSPCAAQNLHPLLPILKPLPPFLYVKFKELKLIWLVWGFFNLFPANTCHTKLFSH